MNELEDKSSEWWEQRAKEVGFEQASKEAEGLRAKGGANAEVGINNYLKILEISRHERDVKALNLASKANTIARSTRFQIKLTWIVGAVVAVVIATFF